jgi:hypothetical protein
MIEKPPPLFLPPKPAIIRAWKREDLRLPRATFPFPFFVPSSRLPPAYIGRTNSGNQTGTSVSFSHTTTAGTSALILLIHGWDHNSGNAPTITSATFDGVAASSAAQSSNGTSGFDGRSAIFHLFTPGAKTANVVVTFANANSLSMHVTAINASGVTALDNFGSDNTNTTTMAVALNPTAPSLIVGAAVGNRSGGLTFTWSGGVNEIVDYSPDPSNNRFGSGYRVGTAAETYTFQAIASAATNVHCLAAAAYR